MNKFSCLSEFCVDSLKMESMILDGINVLKCDIKFQSCWDEMPVINFDIPTSQVWTTLLPFGVELFIWQVYYHTDTSCFLCNFGILSSQYIRYCKIRLTGVWQSHLGDKKNFPLQNCQNCVPFTKETLWMCKLLKGSASSPRFSVQLTSNDPKVMLMD